MNQQLELEERIARWLDGEAPGDLPDRVLESTFERTRALHQERQFLGGYRLGRRRSDWLLAAALLIAAAVVAYALAGGILTRPIPVRPSDGLDVIRSAGVLRIAIRPDHPQTVGTADTADGFDVDVAREIGRRLGIDVELVELSPDQMVGDRSLWDVALPSTAAWTIDPAAYVMTSPYYFWPHLLVVPSGSGATSLADVQGQPMCAVRGDEGRRWLTGAYGGPSANPASGPPIPSSLLLRDSDLECIAALDAGEVLALVTATLSPADVTARPSLRVAGGPPPEPRAMVIDGQRTDLEALRAAIERALSEIRQDGMLARLSLDRFGSDLTVEAP